MSMRHAVLYLGDHLEQGWLPARGAVVPGEPPAGASLVAVVDSADEMHAVTTLPAVRGSHAIRLLQRRLEREYPDTGLRAAIRLKRRGPGAPAEAVLLALSADAELVRRLEALGEAHALCAVTTPSLLVAAWLRRARLRPRRLLVMLPTPAGLRLVFIEDGQPSLSRLMPPLDTSGGTAGEIARTIEYLQNTNRLERNEALEIWCWGMSAEDAAACEPGRIAHVFSAAPHRPNLPDPQRDGLPALLALASTLPAGTQLAADALRLGWFARQAGRWSRGLAAAVLLIAIGASIVFTQRAQSLQREAAQVRASYSAISSNRAELDARLAERGLQLEDVLVLPAAAQALRTSAVALEEAFAVVGRSFGAETALQLQALEFRSMPLPAMSAPEAFGCDGEELPPAPIVKVAFGLPEELDLRTRSAALAKLRASLPQLAPWQPSPRSARLGTQDELMVSAGQEQPPGRTEQTACLLRGDGA